jgi:uncharacterized protein (DUF2384 family)
MRTPITKPTVSEGKRSVAPESSTACSVDDYVHQVSTATPLELVEIERQGVRGVILKSLSRKMSVPISYMYKILGVPKATAEKKMGTGEFVTGSSGHAAIGMIRLLGIAQNMAENSTAEIAKDFDASKWLGQWIELPQAALGGCKPADLIDTPTGIDIVARLLGAIESGAYQ